MSGPTPPPWEFDYGDDGTDYSHPYCVVTADDGELVIAEVNDKFSRDEGHANGRLIAAATELLEALIEAEPFVQDQICYASTTKEHAANKVAVQIKAAIAKATGVTP